MTDCDAATRDVVKSEMSASCVANAVLPLVITDSDNDQSSHARTTAVPPLNTTVPNVTVTVPNVTTTVPQVTCHSVRSLHTAEETFPPSSSVSSSKTSASPIHGMVCV